MGQKESRLDIDGVWKEYVEPYLRPDGPPLPRGLGPVARQQLAAEEQRAGRGAATGPPPPSSQVRAGLL